MSPPSWLPSHLLPHLIPLGCHRAPDLSSLYHISNYLWLSILCMVTYMRNSLTAEPPGKSQERTFQCALGRPRGTGWRGGWDGGSGWGIHVYPWLIHVNVWQKPLQYCKVISLQLIKKIKKHQVDMFCTMRKKLKLNHCLIHSEQSFPNLD